jgi:hypothetical protein
VACDSSCKDITIFSNVDPSQHVKNLTLYCEDKATKEGLEKLFFRGGVGYRAEFSLDKACKNLKLKGKDLESGDEVLYYSKE